ncbi:hypothetical protein CEXT_462521 [Caerostris extrusa]|uniref:Uncharacterized protein n=1 Tax=Caerostris extrusa TaxID=172846 RepID=A0AAV4WQ34_CAEEX|nr:hypothetical protein CEXT_462521 [Caerostris extrusa]
MGMAWKTKETWKWKWPGNLGMAWSLNGNGLEIQGMALVWKWEWPRNPINGTSLEMGNGLEISDSSLEMGKAWKSKEWLCLEMGMA